MISLHGKPNVKTLLVAFFKKKLANARPTLKVTLCVTFRRVLQICVSPANNFIINNAIISGTKNSSVTLTVKTLATPLGYPSLISPKAEFIWFS
jgi:hypothetical protein